VTFRSAKTTDLRIVSLAPSATSILCALGARKLLVGVTKWCALVAPVNALPKLGDCWRNDSLHKLLGLRPSLAIGSVPFKAETVATLLEQPLQFLALNPRTLADIRNDIRVLARIVDRVGAGERLIARMSSAFEEIRSRRLRSHPRPRVYCEAWPNPRISSPPWVAELVEMCGGQMVLPSGKRITTSQVAQAKPEIIILAWAATGAKADPRKAYNVNAWKNVPAVRNRRVQVIRDELLNTPGPPLIQGARRLWQVIQRAAEGTA
jgi:ABC-type Fe3+-hydroxamate transport system substrate-binding protein